jgi:hypothetical protein
MEKILVDEENAILSDLETTDIFKLKGRVKNYIENNVKLNRQASKTTMRKMH